MHWIVKVGSQLSVMLFLIDFGVCQQSRADQLPVQPDQGAELGGWHGLPAAQSSTFYQIIGISLQSQNHHGTGSLEKLYLRWNDFESNLSGMFRELIIAKDFFNVTLACDDDQKQAHKVILSACSPFIRNHLESQQTWASSAVPERRIVCWPGVCT